MWVRLGPSGYVPRFVEFQFTHPCGCDITRAGSVESWAGFNSRTRVGATLTVNDLRFCHTVSIHAPVWVRPPMAQACPPHKRFQFTHPCGCDAPSISIPIGIVGFNSRTRVGATILPALDDLDMMFQFTHPCGCDGNIIDCPVTAVQFQFTHPCGCDLANHFKFMHPAGFNSRTRVGATSMWNIYAIGYPVSIHAPVWVRPPPSGRST